MGPKITATRTTLSGARARTHTPRLRLALFLLALLPGVLTACLRTPAPATGTLSGTATLEDGAPAAGATVTLLREPGSDSAGSRSATTDAEGRFRLERLRTGVYWLTVQADGPRSALLTDVEILEDQETAVEPVLTEAGAISGVATLGDRPEDGGILVSIPGTPFTTETGSGGAYELTGVPAGAFEVSFAASGYAAVTRSEVEVEGGATTTLPDVTLERTAPYARFSARVNGNVVELDASGSYDPNGRILTYRWDYGDGTRLQGGAAIVRHVHEYGSSGAYTISLTVINDRGFSDTISQEVTVTLPQLRLSGSPHDLTLPPGSARHYDVVVPTGTRGDVLYVEAQGAETIEVRRGAETYYSTAVGTFRLLGEGAASDGTAAGAPEGLLAPQAISVERSCLGPCVLLPVGSATLTLHNPGPLALQVRVHLSAEGYADANEPNDRLASATHLAPGTDGGAIELVDDVDWFRVAEAGRLTLDAPPAIELLVTHHDPAGGRLGTIRSGAPVDVRAGDLVRVRAARSEAGPSAVSAYYLSLR